MEVIAEDVGGLVVREDVVVVTGTGAETTTLISSRAIGAMLSAGAEMETVSVLPGGRFDGKLPLGRVNAPGRFVDAKLLTSGDRFAGKDTTVSLRSSPSTARIWTVMTTVGASVLPL